MAQGLTQSSILRFAQFDSCHGCPLICNCCEPAQKNLVLEASKTMERHTCIAWLYAGPCPNDWKATYKAMELLLSRTAAWPIALTTASRAAGESPVKALCSANQTGLSNVLPLRRPRSIQGPQTTPITPYTPAT